MNRRKLGPNGPQGLVSKRSAAVGGLAVVLLTGGGALAHADDVRGVQPASLDVKSRIKSMEQVNVTAEKPIDESAPPPSALVADLLEQLQASDQADSDNE